MATFRQAPEPDYEYVVAEIVAAYEKAMTEIRRELERADISNLSRASSAVMLAQIQAILDGLDRTASDWSTVNIKQAAADGIARAIISLGAAENMTEAYDLVRFNRANQALVAAAVADTQADLLAVMQNVSRRVRQAVRSATAEAMRANYAKGVVGRRTINRETLAGLRNRLGSAVDTGIIDAAGRRWKPEVYVDTVTRTKLMNTNVEATTSEAVQRGALYAVISRHNATDACRYHQGRIIKLVEDAPGDYPTYNELRATGQIFHPNCKHTISPVRVPDSLPAEVRERAERQAQEGNAAIATGKRNPTAAQVEEREE